MARGSVQQRMTTVAGFLIGLRHRQIVGALAHHGLTPEEVVRGWNLIRSIESGDRGTAAPNTSDLIAELDQWENVWFAVAGAVLANRFPEVHARIFENLHPQARAKVVLSVQTFIERIDALAAGTFGVAATESADAVSALAARGLNTSTLGVARQLLQRIRSAEDDDQAEQDRVAEQVATEAMWRWYKEWSGIARAVLTDRNQLRALGLAQDRKTVEEDDSSGPDAADSLTARRR